MKPCLIPLTLAFRFLWWYTFCTVMQISSTSPRSEESQHVRIGRYVRHPRLHNFLRAPVLFLNLGASYASTGGYQNCSSHTAIPTQTVTTPDTACTSTRLCVILMMANALTYCLIGVT